MLRFILEHLKEIIVYSMLGLALVYTLLFMLIKKMGEVTNIDEDDNGFYDPKDVDKLLGDDV